MTTITALLHSARRAATAVVLLLPALAGCTSSGKPIPEIAPEINATLQKGPTRFLPGDRIFVRFMHDATLDQRVDVRPDGKASFLMVGEFDVAGRTADELTKTLMQAYKPKIDDVDLVANIELGGEAAMRDNARRVFVLGEVTYPGAYSFTGEPLTIPKALALAHGALKPSASLESMLLVRWMPEPAGYRGWKIDAGIDYWSSPEQVLLQPGDVLYVPNTTIDKADIWVDKYIRQLIPFPYLSYYIVNQPATPTN